MYLKNSIFFLLLVILSCQPVEIISPIEFNNSTFAKISINAEKIIVNNKYLPLFSEENIEDQLDNTPINLINSWINDNIDNFGNQNKFYINILQASIKKNEIENKEAKKYEEKTIFFYEVFFLIEYELYDDNNYLLANTMVESTRSTTSHKYISINETEIIIYDLLNKALKDFTNETKSMINTYMAEYI